MTKLNFIFLLLAAGTAHAEGPNSKATAVQNALGGVTVTVGGIAAESVTRLLEIANPALHEQKRMDGLQFSCDTSSAAFCSFTVSQSGEVSSVYPLAWYLTVPDAGTATPSPFDDLFTVITIGGPPAVTLWNQLSGVASERETSSAAFPLYEIKRGAAVTCSEYVTVPNPSYSCNVVVWRDGSIAIPQHQ